MDIRRAKGRTIEDLAVLKGRNEHRFSQLTQGGSKCVELPEVILTFCQYSLH
jgi:hypothetical protein